MQPLSATGEPRAAQITNSRAAFVQTAPVAAGSALGGSARARCEGLRYGPEPFGAHH